MEVVREVYEYVIVMKKGKIVEKGDKEKVLDNKSEEYKKEIMEEEMREESLGKNGWIRGD